MDRVGIKASNGYDLFDLGNSEQARGSLLLVEIARRLSKEQIACLVDPPALDDREVGSNGAFQNIVLAAAVLDLVAFGDAFRPRFGCRNRNARAARTAPLC